MESDPKPEPTSNISYQEAERIVKEKLGFYSHLITYVVIISFLFALNLLTSPGHIWAFWPALGWGIGIASHAARVFWFGKASSLRRRMIEREMQNHNK